MAHIIELSNVAYAYNGRPILHIPHLEIEQGAIVGLAGPNGSGKSTLLKILGFVEKCGTGTVLFHGKNAVPFSDQVRFRVSLLCQEPYLLKRSVFDNIAYGLRLRGEKNIRHEVESALELVGLPASFAMRHWFELSGGEAQRVALAARLALKPDCLLLDEPTASVDVQSAERIRQAIVMARRERGTTLVIASHNRSWLSDICDRILFLHNGRMLEYGDENILYGPWEGFPGGKYGKRLTDGQLLHLSAPGISDSCLIPPDRITLFDGAEGGVTENMVSGRIAAIFQESTNGGIRLQIKCGELSLAVSAEKEFLVAKQWLPGQRVLVSFAPADVIWL